MEVCYKSSLDVFLLCESIAYDFVIVLDPKIITIEYNTKYFGKIYVLLHMMTSVNIIH